MIVIVLDIFYLLIISDLNVGSFFLYLIYFILITNHFSFKCWIICKIIINWSNIVKLFFLVQKMIRQPPRPACHCQHQKNHPLASYSGHEKERNTVHKKSLNLLPILPWSFLWCFHAWRNVCISEQCQAWSRSRLISAMRAPWGCAEIWNSRGKHETCSKLLWLSNNHEECEEVFHASDDTG